MILLQLSAAALGQKWVLSPQRCHNLRKTTKKPQNLLNRQTRQSKASQTAIVQKLRSETGKNAKTRSQSSHGQNKLTSRQRQQNQATQCVFVPSSVCESVFVCFHLWCWRPCLCLCHSKCVSCVVLDKQAGTVFEKCVLLGTYHRGTRGKQSNQRGQNCLDIK